MFESLWSIILSIVGNLLTPFFQKLFGQWIPFASSKSKAEPSTPPAPMPASTDSPTQIEDLRARNRERMQATFGLVLLYSITAFVLYGVIAAPAYFKAVGELRLNESGFSLAETRLDMDLWISRDLITTLAITIAAFFYIPILKIAQQLAYALKFKWTQYYKLKPLQAIGFVMISFFALALLVSGHCIYFLYPKLTYAQSVIMPFAITFGGFALMESQNRK